MKQQAAESGVLRPTLSTFMLEGATGPAAKADSAVCEAETFRYPSTLLGIRGRDPPRKRAEPEYSGKDITPGGGRPSSWYLLLAVS